MSKKLLLIAATQQEILPYLQQTHHHDVLITGVGIASATFRLTRKLAHHHYDLVVQAGIAGAFESSFATAGAVLQINKDAFGDLGSYEQGKLYDLNQLELSNEPLWLPSAEYETGLPLAKGITVQTLTNNADLLQALQQKWCADTESMEGAAAAYVCHEKKVPFLQIRAVSNTVGDRNKANWQIDLAVNNLNEVLKALIPRLY
ncbi:MAG: futalosine hydrolase [Chitinophagaceae bacterium]|jgi:futalosine hydrolase|nr:futalosine hydrolase [Chitinophagaceae bacterium]